MSVNSAEIAFRAAMAKPSNDLGSAIELDVLLPNDPVRLAAERMRQRLYATLAVLEASPNARPRSRDIHLGFTDDKNLGATHVPSDGLDLLAMPVGSVLILFDLFYRMMAEPNVLPDVGDPSREVAGRARAEGLQLNYDLLVWNGNRKSKQFDLSAPFDSTRRRHAEALAELALDFLVLHELGHVWNGHRFFGKPKAPVRRFLEADSDVFAGYVAGDQLLRSASSGQKTFETECQAWQFAVAALFGLSAAKYTAPTVTPEEHGYPVWPLRRYLTFFGAEFFFQELSRDDLLDSFRRTCQRMMEAAFSSLHLLDGAVHEPVLRRTLLAAVEREHRLALLDLAAYRRTEGGGLLREARWSNPPAWQCLGDGPLAH